MNNSPVAQKPERTQCMSVRNAALSVDRASAMVRQSIRLVNRTVAGSSPAGGIFTNIRAPSRRVRTNHALSKSAEPPESRASTANRSLSILSAVRSRLSRIPTTLLKMGGLSLKKETGAGRSSPQRKSDSIVPLTRGPAEPQSAQS